jgi:hypothetical protein
VHIMLVHPILLELIAANLELEDYNKHTKYHGHARTNVNVFG